MSRKLRKKCKIYKYNYTCNRLPKKNLLKKSSEIDFSSDDNLTLKKSRFQRILNRVRGKKIREISPSYFITPWFYLLLLTSNFKRYKVGLTLSLRGGLSKRTLKTTIEVATFELCSFSTIYSRGSILGSFESRASAFIFASTNLRCASVVSRQGAQPPTTPGPLSAAPRPE